MPIAERHTPVTDPLIGARIDGRYVIERVHGCGGMSVVYAGMHEELRRQVAIKVLDGAWAADREVVERFLIEARTASSLTHPNVVPVSDLGRLPDGRPYLVMPMIAGHDLATLLAQEGPQPPRRVANLLNGVGSALDLIHRKGLVHRDIKSENLMHVANEDGTETVLVLDFGIAGAFGRQDAIDGTSGTPEFMPPEALNGQVPDHRADVYALATVAFELLTGALPYDSDDLQDLIQKKATQQPRRLSDVGAARFGSGLEAAIARGLSQRPEQRHPSASAFVREFSTAADHEALFEREPVSEVTRKPQRAVVRESPTLIGTGMMPEPRGKAASRERKSTLGIGSLPFFGGGTIDASSVEPDTDERPIILELEVASDAAAEPAPSEAEPPAPVEAEAPLEAAAPAATAAAPAQELPDIEFDLRPDDAAEPAAAPAAAEAEPEVAAPVVEAAAPPAPAADLGAEPESTVARAVHSAAASAKAALVKAASAKAASAKVTRILRMPRAPLPAGRYPFDPLAVPASSASKRLDPLPRATGAPPEAEVKPRLSASAAYDPAEVAQTLVAPAFVPQTSGPLVGDESLQPPPSLSLSDEDAEVLRRSQRGGRRFAYGVIAALAVGALAIWARPQTPTAIQPTEAPAAAKAPTAIEAPAAIEAPQPPAAVPTPPPAPAAPAPAEPPIANAPIEAAPVAPVPEALAKPEPSVAREEIAAPAPRTRAPRTITRAPRSAPVERKSVAKPRESLAPAVLEVRPTSAPDTAAAEQLSQRATDAMLRGDLANAARLYEQALDANPSDAPAWRGKALVLERMGRTREAAAAFREFLRLRPRGPASDKVRERLTELESGR